jgi:hypothetical protein
MNRHTVIEEHEEGKEKRDPVRVFHDFVLLVHLCGKSSADWPQKVARNTKVHKIIVFECCCGRERGL